MVIHHRYHYIYRHHHPYILVVYKDDGDGIGSDNGGGIGNDNSEST